MGTVPNKAIDKVQFYENHIAPFTTNQAAIGVTAAEVTDLTTKTSAARAAYNTQQAAKQAAVVATEAFQNSVLAMSTLGAGMLKNIRAKAETTGNPDVYTLAEIPAPPTPGPRPAPGTPTDFGATLNADGSLTIKFKCSNPAGSSGTIYQVWRKLPEQTTFSYVGGTGAKEYTDMTVPVGTAQVIYKLQAVRSTAAGPWAIFNVFLGVAGNGAMTATVQPVMKAA